MAQCNVCSFVFVLYLFAAAMTECKAYSFSGFEEYDLHTLYKEYGEVWVSLILNTPICNIPGAPQLPKEIKIHHIKYLLDYVPEILPSSLHLEYHDPSQLEDGDVLVIHSLWMWKTYAIVSSAKEKKVICFATRDQRPVSDMEALFTREDVRLQEVSFDEVLDRDHGVVEVIRQENHKNTLQNATTALASEHPWSLFGFNSEHFVTHVITGRAQSPQLDSLLCVHKKAVLSGIMAGLVTPESCTILRKYAQCVVIITTNNVVSSSTKVTSSQITKETMKRVTNKVIISSTRGAASHVAKQTAKKTARKVVSGSTRAVASHVTKETAKKTAKKVVSSSTKTAASHMARETAKKATRKVVSSSTKAGATHVAKETTKKATKKVISSSTKNVASHMAKETAKKAVSSSTKTAASHVAKETAKKATKKFVSRSTQAAASHVAKETVKKTARKAVSSSTKATASHMAKQTAKKTAKKVIGGSTKATASQVAKQTAKEATEEVAGATATTATSRLASGAKAGFIAGALAEGVCLAYTGYSSYEMMKKGEISSTEFRQHMVKRSAAAGGSLAGGAIGGAIGTVIIPVPFLGTFIGSVVGGVVGDLAGSKLGEEFDKYAFNQNEAAV